MSFTVRAASTADVSAMHRVRRNVLENRLTSPERVKEASYLPYVRDGSIWVAEADGEVVGFAAIDASTKRVWALFIDPEAEGAGIGRALHRQMLTWAQAQGFTTLSLSTDKGTRAAQFYKRAGWIETGSPRDGEAAFVITLPR